MPLSRVRTARVEPHLGGIAVVCCVHDREKRQVTNPDLVAKLGLELDPPLHYNPSIHYLITCACCENLFVSLGDTPKFCNVCTPDKPLMHPLGGPMAAPHEGRKE